MAYRSAVRTLAWSALAGQVVFVVSWVVAGSLESGYSHVESGVSALARQGAENPGLVMAGLVVLGASFAALGVALALALPSRPASQVAAGLFVAVGAGFAASGLLRLDCDMGASETCRDLWDAGALSDEHAAHLWLGLVITVLLVATGYAVSRALWPSPVAAAALGGANIGVGIALASWAFIFTSDAGSGGLVQRLEFLVVHGWVAIVAVGLLYVTRRPLERGPLIRVRPRDFLAREWTGEGELVLRPLFLGRFFAQRFHARRRSTWISERVWRVEDVATFERGHEQRREMWCEFVSDDHVRLTAGDFPDGADAWIEPDGFRIAPFRFAFPLGPVPWLGWCRDRSRVLPDGTFVNELHAYTLGLRIPIARLTFRVRPVAGIGDSADAPELTARQGDQNVVRAALLQRGGESPGW